MLRMGRSPKVEPNEDERQQLNRPAPAATAAPPASSQQSAASQPVAQQPQATPAPPARVEPERPSSTTRAVSESEALARDLKDGLMSGFVGGGTVLNGDADFKGMLRIDGHFSGRITSEKGTLIVSAGGRVDANLWVGTAKVNGVVNGDITAAERIELGRSAQVRGNIHTPTLIVEQGAIFEGGCRMTQVEPVKTQRTQETAATSPRPQPQPAPARPRPTAAPQTQPLAAPKMPAAASADAGGATQGAEVSKAVV